MQETELELVSYNLCPYVQRAVITLAEKNIPHRRTYIDLANKPEWFRAISPLGKVPLLKVGGEVLFESAVICEYLDEVTPGQLHPDDALHRAKHRAWIEFGSSILDAIAGFYSGRTTADFEKGRERLIGKFGWLERHLGDGPYFAGKRFHLVDAVYPTVFRYFDTFERIGDFGFFDRTPRVSAYREALAKRPSVRNAVLDSYGDELMAFLKRRGSVISSLAEVATGCKVA